MKFISQRNIALLCYSSNMAAANTLYCSRLLCPTPFCVEGDREARTREKWGWEVCGRRERRGRETEYPRGRETVEIGNKFRNITQFFSMEKANRQAETTNQGGGNERYNVLEAENSDLPLPPPHPPPPHLLSWVEHRYRVHIMTRNIALHRCIVAAPAVKLLLSIECGALDVFLPAFGLKIFLYICFRCISSSSALLQSVFCLPLYFGESLSGDLEAESCGGPPIQKEQTKESREVFSRGYTYPRQQKPWQQTV